MTELFAYQKVGVELIEKFRGRALLADEMGLGKTIQSLAWYREYLFPEGPAIVVCPAGLKWNWQNEARHHFGLRTEVLEGMRAPRRAGYISRRSIFVINYEILRNLAWVEFLRGLKPKLIIGDEVQRIQNPLAQQTKAFVALCRKIDHVILLSGTPLTNRPAELFTALSILRPKTYKSAPDFYWKYTQPEKIYGTWYYKGACNLPQLHAKLKKEMMIRRLKKDVLKDLPPKTRVILPVDIADRRQYTIALTNFIRWMRAFNPKKATAAERANKLVQLGYLRRLAARLKMVAVNDWISGFLNDSDGKLIVFGVHKKILKPLHKRFPNSVLVDGSVTGRDRQKAIDQFTNDKRCRLFFGNIQAAGVGWNGVAASAVAFVELTWDPASHIQAEDRIHRIGQKSAAMIYYLIARNTIESVMSAILQRKQRILDEVLDGSVDTSGLGVFNSVVEQIMRAE